MKSNLTLDWAYYLGTVVVMTLGFYITYLGSRVYNHMQLRNIGLWVILLGILAFLTRNAYYMIESSDPDGLVDIGPLTVK